MVWIGEPQRVRLEPEAPRAERHLPHGLLAGRVQDWLVPAQRVGGLQQQRRLADAGIAAEQHDRAGHEAATEHPVEFPDTGGRPQFRVVRDLRHRPAGGRRCG